jgi:hypothetical protein
MALCFISVGPEEETELFLENPTSLEVFAQGDVEGRPS